MVQRVMVVLAVLVIACAVAGQAMAAAQFSRSTFGQASVGQNGAIKGVGIAATSFVWRRYPALSSARRLSPYQSPVDRRDWSPWFGWLWTRKVGAAEPDQ